MHEIFWGARRFLETLGARAAGGAGRRHPRRRADVPRPAHAPPRLAQNAPILLLCTSRHDLSRSARSGEKAGALAAGVDPLAARRAPRWSTNLLGATGLPPDVIKRLSTLPKATRCTSSRCWRCWSTAALYAQEDGKWVHTHELRRHQVPPTIEALIEGRLGQLKREERAAIEPASVIGLQFAGAAVLHLRPSRSARIGGHLLALRASNWCIRSTRSMRTRSTASITTWCATRLRRPAEARARHPTRRLRTLGRPGQRGARPRAGIRGDPRLPPRAGHRYLAELGPLDGKGREIGKDAAERLARAGRRAFARGDLHAAENLLRRAIALVVDEDPLLLTMLPSFSEVLLTLGRFADARAIADQAFVRAEESGNHRVKAASQIVKMLVALQSGELRNPRKRRCISRLTSSRRSNAKAHTPSWHALGSRLQPWSRWEGTSAALAKQSQE